MLFLIPLIVFGVLIFQLFTEITTLRAHTLRLAQQMNLLATAVCVLSQSFSEVLQPETEEEKETFLQ